MNDFQPIQIGSSGTAQNIFEETPQQQQQPNPGDVSDVDWDPDSEPDELFE
jgi:hypothetical protein